MGARSRRGEAPAKVAMWDKCRTGDGPARARDLAHSYGTRGSFTRPRDAARRASFRSRCTRFGRAGHARFRARGGTTFRRERETIGRHREHRERRESYDAA